MRETTVSAREQIIPKTENVSSLGQRIQPIRDQAKRKTEYI